MSQSQNSKHLTGLKIDPKIFFSGRNWIEINNTNILNFLSQNQSGLNVLSGFDTHTKQDRHLTKFAGK